MHQNASHLTQRTQGLLIRQQDVTEHLILTGSAFNPGVPGLLDTTQPSDWLHSCYNAALSLGKNPRCHACHGFLSFT